MTCPSLRVGVYTISASAPGFSDAVAKNITVSVGNVQHIDLTLKVGATETTIEVSDVALQIEDGDQRARPEHHQLSERGASRWSRRNYSDLLALIPGSRQAPYRRYFTSSSQLAGPRRDRSTSTASAACSTTSCSTVIDNNAYGESNQGFDNQIIAVPPDSVAQFQVVTNNESAEYGRSSGATINVASQSGTNHIHATLYEFIRNTDLNAAGFFKPTIVGNTGVTRALPEADIQPQPVRLQSRRPDHQGQALLLRRLRRIPPGFQASHRAHPADPGRIDGNGIREAPSPVTANVLTRRTDLPVLAFSPFAADRGAINPLSPQIISVASSRSVRPARLTAWPAPVWHRTTTPCRSRSTDDSDKGDLRFDWQITPSRSAFLRVSDRKEDAINFAIDSHPARRPDQRPHPPARPADRRSATPSSSVPTRFSMPDLVSIAPRPASITSPSETRRSITSPACPPRNAVVAGGLPSIGITEFHRLRPPEHQSAVAGPGPDRSQGQLHLG